jgi:hypothetical protein
MGVKAVGGTAVGLGRCGGGGSADGPAARRAHSSLPDAFVFLCQDVLFCCKALNLCGYFYVITIFTVSEPFYIASFRTPTSSWALPISQ